jgi:alpha-2-macroglobulin
MMKCALLILFWFLPWIARSAETENASPDTAAVRVEPSSGSIEAGTVLTLTFPTSMIESANIDVPNQPLPFTSQPELEGEFLWKSPTEGAFTVKRVKAGATYHLSLAPELTDLARQPVPAKDWSAEFTTAEFSVTTDFEVRHELSSQPQLPLESTYAVRLTDVVEHTYFQDRDSRQRFPVDVIQGLDDSPEGREFRVTPREPLPVGRTYDLIVDGLVDAGSHEPLSYPRVFPAGTTAPLKIEWVGAFNHALEEPMIQIKFNDEFDPAQVTPDKIRIEPAVEHLKLLADGQIVTARGDFDLAQHYVVTVLPDLKGQRGYDLPVPSKWGATFHPKDPCLIFPSSQLFMRALKELHFSFLQVNTGPVEWKLARIPLEKLGAVNARLLEFEQEQINPLTGKSVVDPRTGFAVMRPTDLLVQSFGLPVVSQGTLDASNGEEEALREIRCESNNSQPFSGPYLLEASTTPDGGRIVGNRSIILVSNYIVSQKRSPDSVIVRIAAMADAQPVAGVAVRAVTAENIELQRAITDQNGMATFSRAELFPGKPPRAALLIADTVDGPVVRTLDANAGYTSGSEVNAAPQTRRGAIITDRNLYRPGQTVKIKGIIRDANDTKLTIPASSAVSWQVAEGDEKRILKEGTTALSSDGTWEASWEVPQNARTGHYQIRCKIGKDVYAGAADVDIEEYRVPLFSVLAEAANEVGPVAHLRISSAYFHGAPNAGAHVHWKATWTASAEIREESFKCYNSYAEVGSRLDPDNVPTKTLEGDTQLDEHGQALLQCEAPFQNNLAVGLCDILWRAEVTSVDGQTLVGGASALLSSAPTRLAVQATADASSAKAVQVQIKAFNLDNQPVTDIALQSDLFFVVTKTVKEQVAPFVYRYRNTDRFTKIASQELKGSGTIRFDVPQTGRYVVAVSAPGVRTPLVSDETTITGEEPAELPVENETSFQIEHRAEPFVPGETAVLTTKAPFPGMAWVSIETDKILDTLLVPIPGNAGRIEIPIKDAYAPNAFVSIYLTRPGGENGLPLERFAYTQIVVHRPDWNLKIEPHLPASTAQPGELIHGQLHVTSEGKPAPDADLAVFVVDDAVLQLGGWELPDLVASFYYERTFGIKSYESLDSLQEAIPRQSLTHKGFVIGDGGEDKIGSVVNARKEFQTLAFWAGALKTDQDGNASFEFTAPDNLTTYRLVALGDTKESRFGADAGTTLKVFKPVLVQAALPRFLRDGDEIELRAVVHQSFANSDQLYVRCSTDANCTLSGTPDLTATVGRDVPAVFRFKARVTDHERRPTKIRFEVTALTDVKMTDSIEVTLPVDAPTVTRVESVAGSLSSAQLDVQTLLPQAWKHGRGTMDVTVSTSPWLPEMAGLPSLLEYPHGCFEQISSRLLGYALLGNLLAYLPDSGSRDREYRAVIGRGLQQIDESVLENGMLPYWPGDTVGNAFVTAQSLWAVDEAADAGLVVQEDLATKLRGALTKIVQGQFSASRFEQVFALFALSHSARAQDFSGAAEELYLRRNETGDEGRALLALALHRLAIMPQQQDQLLREIDSPVKPRAFNALTFTSTTRAEAICTFALATIAPKSWTPEKQKRVRDRLNTLMSASASLSTQENLWLLLAFKSILGTEESAPLEISDAQALLSKNGRSAAWLNCSLPDVALTASLPQQNLSYLLRAKYASESPQTERVDRGMQIERVVHDLTDAKRTGNAETPFKLGDQILITYRVNTQKTQNYVALEDLLPAGLETVNPALAMIAKFFEIPSENTSDRTLILSHSELRDRSTLLYFNELLAGPGQYSVLARATAAGAFRWPATQISPMYDSRFSGLTPSSVCVVSGE